MAYRASHYACFAVSHFWYIQNTESCFEMIVIAGRKMNYLGYHLVIFKYIETRIRPKDGLCWAAYFTYQTLNYLINICGLKVRIHLINHQLLIG